jgi:hypothetical protein
VLISQTFPLLKQLEIFNVNGQKKKVTQKQQDDDEQISSRIEFPHLFKLDLSKSNIDYAKQLLFDCNTRLSSLHTLCIDYNFLVMITENFTNNAGRANCAKVQHVIFDSIPIVHPENFFLYFPFL